MTLNERIRATGVGVWHFPTQSFVQFIPTKPGEKRVRLDVHDDLANYAVYAGHYEGDIFYPAGQDGVEAKPLLDWEINYS